MRRLIVLLTLLSGGLSQQVATACAMGSDAGILAPAVERKAGEEAGAGHAGHAPDERDRAPHAPGPDGSCRLLVACAGAALAAAEPTTTRANVGEAGPGMPAMGRVWTTNFPQNDTPPPRLRV